ncbi:LAGLIDADG family homing endonuclease [Halobaculum litoreum]|uniref:LAGLIDADG family homing endonuclease n=1 Tax=Halobaculum litoreum TaxID=3031998 RepID=UPI0024C33ABB|nr:LAGLIDADG family homing endonuclease [Halobaculum sp. DT92]
MTDVTCVRQPTVEIQTEDVTVCVGQDARILPYTHDFRDACRFRAGQRVKTVLTPTPDPHSPAYRDGYVHGAFAGDGSVVKTKSTKNATLRCQDEAIIERVDAFARDEYGLQRKGREFNGLHEIRTTIWKEVDLLDEVLPIDPALVDDLDYCRGWLAGMFDTDGSFDGHTVRFTQTKPEQRKALQQLLSRLGFEYVVEPGGIRVRGANSRLRVLSAIRPAVSRKIRSYAGIMVNGSAEVVSVAERPVRDTYDISLDSGDAYVLEGVCVEVE